MIAIVAVLVMIFYFVSPVENDAIAAMGSPAIRITGIETAPTFKFGRVTLFTRINLSVTT